MPSSTNMNHPRFFEANYDNTFYYCANNHPFIAFTTCYCPMCDANEDIQNYINEVSDLETDLDDIREKHESLVIAVSKSSPELLL